MATGQTFLERIDLRGGIAMGNQYLVEVTKHGGKSPTIPHPLILGEGLGGVWG